MKPKRDSALEDLQRTIAGLERELAERTAALDEAFAQQAATRDALKTLSRSTFALEPVLETVAKTAAQLCGAEMAFVSRRDGDTFRFVTAVGSTPETIKDAVYFQKTVLDTRPFTLGRETIAGRTALEGHALQIADVASEPGYKFAEAFTVARIRTLLGVPLLRDGVVVGTLSLARQRVAPFTEKQIELVSTFADQAVIAIENTRLITETREALEQQTATAEVLGVINSSPGNLTPVFEAMLEKALRLCEAETGHLSRYENGVWSREASLGVPEEFDRLFPRGQPLSHVMTPASPPNRMTATRTIIHIADMREDESYRTGAPAEVAGVQAGIRTALFVPLLKEGDVVGCFVMHRMEVRPFTDKQVALLQNFAAQAVIAMENARLITETRERTADLRQSLEYQTATSDVLQVISRSTFDLDKIFETVVGSAIRLCRADNAGIYLNEAGEYRRAVGVAVKSPDYDSIEANVRILPGPGTVVGRAALEQRTVQIEDAWTDPLYEAKEDARIGGVHTMLGVPLLREGAPIGVLALAREQTKSFSEAEIQLVTTFADQAVIAIENARLITETREALDQQTATAEVLGVINSSPGDLTPVFDTMLEKAMRLCEAAFGGLWTNDNGLFRTTALLGVPALFAEFHSKPLEPVPGTGAYPLVAGESFVHIPDLAGDEGYRSGTPVKLTLYNLGGARTVLFVALRKDTKLLGFIMIYRQEVRPYTDKQIALLQNFAAQAVIAMENARLITETREALEQQTATAAVLGVINSSPGDLAPVFDAILDKAHTLCGVAHGSLQLYDGSKLHAVATKGVSSAFADVLRQGYDAATSPASRELLAGSRFTHILDSRQVDHPVFRSAAEFAGIRTVLFVPLRKDDALLGLIAAARLEVRPFTDKEIALLQNFAAQAVIAMENARLLTETRERTAELQEALEYQTATSDVLKVISRSTFDLDPVLDFVLETVMRLCDNDKGEVFRLEDGVYRMAVARGLEPEYLAIEAKAAIRPGTDTLVGRTALEGRPVHILDAWTDPLYGVKDEARVGKSRTMLGVPLLREGVPIGVICTAKSIVEPFTDRQIELVRTFADQSVIAIENARLLGELRQRQAELRVTFDNMADGVAMFDQELRLAAWNRNFQELLGLPEDFFAEPQTYDSFIRYLAERGEYGDLDPRIEIARLRAEFGDHFRFERTRPDGTVIEVRHNPMPDGGFVLIYSDITERKRSEAEIRAARDAAEAAYADLKAAQANLIQAEKMASLGQLTAGIAHEIKNPLNFVNNFASLSVELLDELKETAAPALATLDKNKRADVDDTMELLTGNLEKIAEHGKRADNIVKSMLEHSRGVSGERREVDLNGVIEEALNLAYHGARAQDQSFNITLERDYAKSLQPMELAPQEMTRVFLNLFSNGFYAATKRARENGDGAYRPSLSVVTREDDNAVEVRVRDNGIGIPPEIKDNLFQPFFTTKPTGEGTGLGLSISYDIVTQQHGGTITVESEPGAYTEFTIRLPRH